MRKLLALLLVAGISALPMAGAHAATKTAAPLWTDPAGDAGNDSAGPLPAVDQAGLDLVSGGITTAKGNLTFTVTDAAMPATGSLPEFARLIWVFSVDGKEYRWTIKSQDVGKPDVVGGGTGVDRIGKVYANGEFRLEQCSDDTTLPVTLVQCAPLLYADGKFDPASKTISWVLPEKTVKAHAGSVIAPGTGGTAASNCVICWVPHYAERSLTPYTIIDSAGWATTYTIPKK
ncbi:MAG: hypothetical protein QOF16_1519 [Actinomycetota bacterium]|jgi:hypothetical protein|nr:hypothetical protein [Actinomycetota bacterium]MEA2487865.1 hypothetical protein [Actinomycetota bacterium]